MPKLNGHVERRRESLAGALGQGFQADPLEFLRHVIVNLAGRLGFLRGDLFQQVRLGQAGERAAAHQQLIKHRTEAVNVAAAVHAVPFTPRLFGTHVERRPGKAWAMTEVLVPQGQAKIDEVRHVVVVKKDVARLDVPMDQPVLVGAVQRFGQSCHQLGCPCVRQSGLFDPRGQIGPIDPLGNDIAGALVRAADIVHGNDVGMVEIGDRAGFGQISFRILRPGYRAWRGAP